jgi:hypothetical protein
VRGPDATKTGAAAQVSPDIQRPPMGAIRLAISSLTEAILKADKTTATDNVRILTTIFNDTLKPLTVN